MPTTGAFTNFMEAEIVRVFLRKGGHTGSDLFLALFSVDPGEAAGGTECSYTNYVRKPVTWTDIDGSGQTSNVLQIDFPGNGGVSPVTVSHICVVDNVTPGQGNRWLYAELSAPKTLSQGDTLSFAPGAIVFGLN
jgi:hypothetical protein